VEPYRTFRYQVARVWQIAPQPLLAGGLGTLPLALISAVTLEELPGIIKQLDRRLAGRRARQASQVWGAAYVLAGLRYSPEFAFQLFRGVLSMRESSTYQAILKEGRAEGLAEGLAEGAVAEARKALRLVAEPVFGSLDPRSEAALERLNDLEKLEALLPRVRTATSWQDLLRPARRRRSS
jgi:predicted transposase YdaD